ncbi:MAG: type II toxin-antitoxin system YafQ family toxin [Oscillospiraceae bacterium]|nr:type II toxin-antitoxin system YafQ family toxin [Oscillospiraceae bacterium]
MLNVVLSNHFKKDLKLASKRGCKLELLDEVINTLAEGKPLAEKHRDHNLTGEYIGFRECHIQPDWLLVYRVEDEDLMLFLFRTGTHSDLFS